MTILTKFSSKKEGTASKFQLLAINEYIINDFYLLSMHDYNYKDPTYATELEWS